MLKRIAFFTAFLTLCLFSQSASGQFSAQPLDEKLKETFRRYDLIKVSPRESARQTRQNGQLTITANNQTLKLELQQRDLLSPKYRAEETTAEGLRQLSSRPEVKTYKGKVEGAIESKVRLVVSDTKIEGFIFVDGNRFYIEPARNYSEAAAADDFVFYEEKDVLNTAPVSCGLPERIAEAAQDFGVTSALMTNTVMRVAEIATDGDFEFVNALGGSANANQEMLGIINMVEGKYEQEIGLTFAVTYQHTWTTPDPYNPSVRPPGLPANIPTSASNNVLGWFQQTWNISFPVSQHPRDFAHLFSGKQGVFGQGVSFIGTVCTNPGFAYGMNGWVNSAPEKFLLAAHEIGHNFNAGHVDGIAGCASTIMLAQLRYDTNFTFCQFSRDQIGGFINASGSCLATQRIGRTKYDFDGDRKADVAVYRPLSNVWHLSNSASGYRGVFFGAAGDRTVPEDYDGDQKTDVAVYRPSNGGWYILLSSNNTIAGTNFGAAGDVPVPADFSGDGKSEVAVFRPSNGTWYIYDLTNGGLSGTPFGTVGDVPLPNDFDADGRADVAVYRPSTGNWYALRSSQGFYGVTFGTAGDRPVPADFDGDGKTDVAVFRPANGNWYIMQSSNGAISVSNFGASTDVPAPADFDGDGKADVNVFRPLNGNWFRLNSNNGGISITAFGTNGDVAVPAAYVP